MDILKCEFCEKQTRIGIKNIGVKVYIESYCSTCNFHSFGEIVGYDELKVASTGREEGARKTYYFQLTGVIKDVDPMQMLKDTGALEGPSLKVKVNHPEVTEIPYDSNYKEGDIIGISINSELEMYKIIEEKRLTFVCKKRTIEEVEKGK